jgi:hypothetical protein
MKGKLCGRPFKLEPAPEDRADRQEPAAALAPVSSEKVSFKSPSARTITTLSEWRDETTAVKKAIRRTETLWREFLLGADAKEEVRRGDWVVRSEAFR